MTETTDAATERTELDDAYDAAEKAGLEGMNLRSTPLPATAVDNQGTERIVSGLTNQRYVPAPVEPHPDAVRRLEAFEQVREAQASARGEALTGNLPPRPEQVHSPSGVTEASSTQPARATPASQGTTTTPAASTSTTTASGSDA